MANSQPDQNMSGSVGKIGDRDIVRAAITAQNQKDSPLLQLPAELRNQIYRYGLGVVVWNVTSGRAIALQSVPTATRKRIKLPCSARPTLLEVCRQVHHETASLPFALATFYSRGPKMHMFFKSLDAAQRAFIKRVWLDMEWEDFVEWKKHDCDPDDLTCMRSLHGLEHVHVEVYSWYSADTRNKFARFFRGEAKTQRWVRNWLEWALRRAVGTGVRISINIIER